MAHAAELDNQNKVLRVLVFDDEVEPNVETYASELLGGVWKQTSYNATFRGKYAGIGDTYNAEEDIFISPQPHPSWTRNGSFWQAPKPYPDDDHFYQWDEDAQDWLKLG